MGGKTRNIAIKLVLQQCCTFRCPFYRTLTHEQSLVTGKTNTAQAQRHKNKNQKKKILVLVFTLGLCLLLGRSYSEKRFKFLCSYSLRRH